MALPASALLIATVTCAGLFLEESYNESRSFLAIVEQFIRERAGEQTERPSIFTVRQRLKVRLSHPLMCLGL